MIPFGGGTFLRTREGRQPFEEVHPALGSDPGCLNLETGLAGGVPLTKNVVPSVDESALGLLPPSVRVVTIVNNHTSGTGDPRRLARALRERGKTVIGPENPSAASTTVDGELVDLIAAYFALPRLHLSYSGRCADAVEALIRVSRSSRRIVSLHWGYEHTNVPAPFQRSLARRFLAAGADLVIGHHPHVPQGWSADGGRMVYYSLGNFNFWQFDGSASDNTRWGYMVRYDPRSGESERVPYRINDNYQPCVLEGAERWALSEKLNLLSSRVERTDSRSWFMTEYDAWHTWERRIWAGHLSRCRSPVLRVKWSFWLLMPMQLRYYAYKAGERLPGIGTKRRRLGESLWPGG